MNLVSFKNKICQPVQLVTRLRALPRPLVFTNGCFDIMHAGHVTYLAQARQLGQSLIVALNTDESVRRLGKGNDRPFNLLEDRLTVMAALACVDCVTWFDDDTPLSLINLIAPNVLVKGGDWAMADIVGASEVQACGGEVHAIPFEVNRSTTLLVEKIRSTAIPCQ